MVSTPSSENIPKKVSRYLSQLRAEAAVPHKIDTATRPSSSQLDGLAKMLPAMPYLDRSKDPCKESSQLTANDHPLFLQDCVSQRVCP